MDFTGYLALARRWWWTFLVAGLVAGGAGYVVATRIPPTYAAQAKLLVGPVNGDFETIRASSELANTYAELATSRALLEPTIQQNGLTATVDDLRENVRVAANGVTRTITIDVELGEPGVAAGVANALADAIVELASGGGGAAGGNLTVVDAAVPSPIPVSPQVPLIIALATAAGLLGAVVIVMLVEHFSDALRDRRELADVVQLPLLGTVAVPRRVVGAQGDPPVVPAAVGGSSASGGYRLLAARLRLAEQPGTSLLLTATTPGDERSVAATLAATRAARAKVVWIDTAGGQTITPWLFQPSVTSATPEHPSPRSRGGSAPRWRQLSLDDNVGGMPDPASLDRAQAREFLRRLLRQAQLVIVSTDSLADSTAVLPWAGACDQHILVVRLTETTREDLRREVEDLQAAGAHTLGVVTAERLGWRTARLSTAVSGNGRTRSSAPTREAPYVRGRHP